MKHGVGRAVVAMVLAAWTTLTLLMINGGTQLVNQTSASVANSPLYNFQPVTVRLDRTNRDLTFPSWKYLQTGKIWSYVSGKQGIDPAFEPPLTDITDGAPSWIEDKRVQPMVKEPLEQLRQAAANAKLPILVSSAYRSGTAQAKIRTETTAKNGAAHTEEYVAKPGHSEHQLGLAVDLTSFSEKCKARFSDCALDPKTASWLAAHAHEYGFILRYPKGKEKITGIASEAWHFRYVGKDLAALIHESGLTFDEVYQNMVKLRDNASVAKSSTS